MATVKVNYQAVINLGNYNSLRLDFGVEDETGESESIEQGFERLSALVESVLDAKVLSEVRSLKENLA